MTHRDLGVAPSNAADLVRLADLNAAISTYALYAVGSSETITIPVNRMMLAYFHSKCDGRIINNGIVKISN